MAKRQVWRLERRPDGNIRDGDLRLHHEEMPALADGQFLVQVGLLSLDPTNRIWMSDREQYMPPVGIGDPMRGSIVGRVVHSRNPRFAEGQLVTGLGEWASHMVADGTMLGQMPEFPGVPLAAAFSTLGFIGPTAYFGLMDLGRPKAGETLVVSSGAGGVGQIVGQIGKIHGCRVIGIAGGPDKCRFMTAELGFDHAIDYKHEDVAAALDRLAPDGVDINFEQVGGAIMTAVNARMKLFGRIVLCGMISTYNDEHAPEAPGMWDLILMRRLSIRGFIVTDFADRFPEAVQALAGWIADGRLRTKQDVRPGLERAVEWLKLLYSGGNFGKLLVEVAPL